MGNYKSKLNQAKQLPFHPNLLEPYVFTKNNQKYMTIKSSSSKEEYETWVKKRNSFKQMFKYQRHLFWPKESQFEKIGLFGDSGFSVLTFSYSPVTLKDEIMNRSRSGVSFQQKELWYLLYSLISLAQQAHRYHETLGDIRPLNILLSDKGQINVITKQSLPTESKNIEKTLKSSMPTFLSPEQMEMIQTEPKKLVKCCPSSECFSIGLTLLMTSILRIGDELYLPPKTFQRDILKQYIRQLDQQTTLDDKFKFLIKGLCQVNPAKRLTVEEVFRCLQNYQKQIYSLSPFQLGQFPEKMFRKLNQQKQKKTPSIDNFSISGGKNQKEFFKTFQDEKENKQNKTADGSKQIKPHYISEKLMRKISKAINNKQQKMGLKVGTLSLQNIQLSALKELLEQEIKSSQNKNLKKSNLKRSESLQIQAQFCENVRTQVKGLTMIPQLMQSADNDEFEKFNSPERKKRVRWEDEMATTSEFKLDTKEESNNSKKIRELNQSIIQSIAQTLPSQKVDKALPFPLTLSTLNSFEFEQFKKSPQKNQTIYHSKIIEGKGFENVNNLSGLRCSMQNKV